MKNIKTLVLDTTYVLPTFGIEVNISKFENEITSLWKNGVNGYKIYLPTTCLYETIFKLLSE